MGALHNVAANYYGTPGELRRRPEDGHPSDKMGFAVGAGITLKADAIAKGDYF